MISPPITVRSVKPLVAVKPKKFVFVSLLASDTSNEDVKSYILSNLSTENLVVVKFKFNFIRKISSFKVSISAVHLPIVYNESFWPPDLIAKEYTPKQKTHAPMSLPSLSVAKNLKNLNSNFFVAYQNVRGPYTKLVKLFADSTSFDYHILVFTQTWLKPDILNSEIFPNKYPFFKCDYLSRSRGDVLNAVDSNLYSDIVSTECLPNIEFVCVK